MSNKKILIIFSILILSIFLISNLNSVKAETAPGLPSGLDKDPEELKEELKNKTQTKWDYLSNEWIKILKDKPLIKQIDSFFEKISILFRILFGMPYSFSITLLGIFFLWVFLALETGEIINKSGLIKGWSAYAGGFLFSILLAQLQILKIIVNFLGWLLFLEKPWYWDLSVILIIILAFVLLYFSSKTLSTYLEKRRKQKAEKETESNQKKIKKFTKGLFRE